MSHIRADLTALQHKYAVKRSGQSPADYAAAVQGYRPSGESPTKVALAIALVLVALYLIGA